ncbi:hypothetical protein A3F29_04275 [Candidatus Roizmanbacteria bacterium RIFCSPHIGHO2_12_FULL_33_9]|uniref:Four helix bundle protein n=1 Tax=Candidatus Roizmanbacteria bacterium RIFCSPHIGHO2_12_FULL_33_9 TaxID=1802045 RepID=A0A1F7HID8_9BACT|nr:MAG: hypothetical protein A3F29_04275 [Candidatus Roizmanbacteria bacterium RIFCSPHIGHO2_12_FULL_33_9]
MNNKVKSFTDLVAWKKSHQFALEIYKITKKFPSEEKFGLIDQLRRASISITSNIAEGFSRRTSKEKIRFYYTAFGSLLEIQSQLLISRDLNYFKDTERIFAKSVEIKKLISGLIKSAKTWNY